MRNKNTNESIWNKDNFKKRVFKIGFQLWCRRNENTIVLDRNASDDIIEAVSNFWGIDDERILVATKMIRESISKTMPVNIVVSRVPDVCIKLLTWLKKRNQTNFYKKYFDTSKMPSNDW